MDVAQLELLLDSRDPVRQRPVRRFAGRALKVVGRKAAIAIAATLFSTLCIADAPSSVVKGRATGHFGTDAEVPCPEDTICMAAWIGWKIDVSKTLSGPLIKGRIRAARIQHATFVRSYLRQIELFVLEPITDPAERRLLSAEYYLRDYAERVPMLCMSVDPATFGIAAEHVYLQQDPRFRRRCFEKDQLSDIANAEQRGTRP